MEHIAYAINMDAVDVKGVNIDTNKYPKIMKFWNEMHTWGDITKRKQSIKAFNTVNTY